MLPPRGLSSLRKNPEPRRSPATCRPAPTSVVPGCKQPDTPDADTTPPRMGTRGQRDKCLGTPASSLQRSNRVAVIIALRVHRRRRACSAACRPEPRLRCPGDTTVHRVDPRAAVTADRLPDHPDVATGVAFTTTCVPAPTQPDFEVPTTDPIRRLVPYRLDTPTTSQVAPRDHQLVSRGWRKPPSARDQECPALPASCEIPAPTWPPEPDFRELDRHVSTRRVHADARCRLSVESDPHGLGRCTEAPRRELRCSSSHSVRCETNVGHQGGVPASWRCCHRSDGPACLPGDPGKPDATRSRFGRAETHLHRNRAATSRPTTSRRANRNLEATDWARLESCPDVRPTTAMLPSPRFAPRVPNKPRRCSGHQTSAGMRIAPLTVGGSRFDRPEGWRFPESAPSGLSPETMGCLASDWMDGSRCAPRRPQRLPTVGKNRTTVATRPRSEEPHECGASARDSKGFWPFGDAARSSRQTSAEAPAMPLSNDLRREAHREHRAMNPDSLQHGCRSSSPPCSTKPSRRVASQRRPPK